MKEYIIKIGDEPDIMGNYGLKEKPKELVRCKDCKFWYKDECSHLCKITGDLHPTNWFCADGERKET